MRLRLGSANLTPSGPANAQRDQAAKKKQDSTMGVRDAQERRKRVLGRICVLFCASMPLLAVFLLVILWLSEMKHQLDVI